MPAADLLALAGVGLPAAVRSGVAPAGTAALPLALAASDAGALPDGAATAGVVAAGASALGAGVAAGVVAVLGAGAPVMLEMPGMPSKQSRVRDEDGQAWSWLSVSRSKPADSKLMPRGTLHAVRKASAAAAPPALATAPATSTPAELSPWKMARARPHMHGPQGIEPPVAVQSVLASAKLMAPSCCWVSGHVGVSAGAGVCATTFTRLPGHRSTAATQNATRVKLGLCECV